MNEKCFALQRDKECRALDKNCHGYCSFYKPVWKHKKERRLANAKLSALPMKSQKKTRRCEHELLRLIQTA